MKGRCSEIMPKGMEITDEVQWNIKASYYRARLWVEMRDRQAEESQYWTYQTIPYQMEQTGFCLGIWSFTVVEALQNFFFNGFPLVLFLKLCCSLFCAGTSAETQMEHR